MATFYNQATLLYNGRAVNSNVTTGEIVDTVAMSKTVISTGYHAGGTVTYVISLTNGGTAEAAALTLTDDLAAYTIGTGSVTPLDYIDGTLRYYLGGVEQPTPTVTAGPPLTVSGITVPAGGNAIIVYEARANGYAPLEAGSSLTNTATLTGAALCETVTDSAAVSVISEAVLSITKTVSPDTVTCNGTLTYTFIIQNTGNTAVLATDDLTVTDTFEPILSDITVTLDGTVLTAGADYTYDSTTGVFSTLPGQITVPAATYTQDAATGLITTTPGVTVLTVSGGV